MCDALSRVVAATYACFCMCSAHPQKLVSLSKQMMVHVVMTAMTMIRVRKTTMMNGTSN